MKYPDPFDQEAESIIGAAEDAGYIFKPKDRKSLIGELTEILEDAWSACGERAREVGNYLPKSEAK